MCIKPKFNRFPDQTAQTNEQLQNAFQALNSSNLLTWEVLPSLPHLSGFIGCKEEKSKELIQNGKITAYDDGNGNPCFLVANAIKLINEDPEINQISWKSYKDNLHTPDDPIIHWIKWKMKGEEGSYLLIKYLFENQTNYTILPVQLWRRNTRIANRIILQINKNLKAQRNGRK